MRPSGFPLGVAVIAAALAVRAFVGYFPSFPAAPPLWAVVAAEVLSLVVGVGFGLWPARRAARLEPIAALARR